MKVLDFDELEELEDFCSNFDGEINFDIAEKLKAGDVYATYPSRDWFGLVYYEDNKYKCCVKRYQSVVGTVEGSTPEELKENVCDKYGYN